MDKHNEKTAATAAKRRARIMRHREAGRSDRWIATKLGLTPQRINQILGPKRPRGGK